MANKHIVKYLNWYLGNSCKAPKFAVLIKGGWGSGKTYFIRYFMKSYEEIECDSCDKNGKTFIYISLYGLASTSEIDDQIFQQLHPVLASKGIAIAGKIAKGLLNLGLQLKLDDGGNTEFSTTQTLPDISIKSFLLNFENKFLVFDDLERCNLPIQNVLGYINTFVEHQDKKVIIIANDDEIEGSLSDEDGVKDSKYHRIKEKVIGKAFSIEANNEEVLGALIEECSQEAKQFLKSKQDLCLEIINTVENATRQRNFRAFSHSLRDFEYIWLSIEEKYRNHLELMTYFTNIYLRFNYELLLSNILEEDILRIDSWRMENIFSESKTNQNAQIGIPKKVDRLDGFFTRHSSIDTYNQLIIPYELWFKLLCQGSNIQTQLNEAFGKSKYFIDTLTPDWEKLWHNMTLEDEELPSLIETVSENINNHKYDDPGVALHVFGIFFSLNQRGYKLPPNIGFNRRAILGTGKSYIDWLELKKKLTYDDDFFKSIEMKFGYLGLGFTSNDMKEFCDLKDYLKHRTIISHQKSLLSRADDLLKIMYESSSDFPNAIANRYFSDAPFWNIPIFASINPEIFMDAFLKVPNKDKRYVLDGIIERYRWLNNYSENIQSQIQELIQEIPFWTKLKSLINKKMEENEIRPSLIWLKGLRDEALKIALGELNSLKKRLKSSKRSNTNS